MYINLSPFEYSPIAALLGTILALQLDARNYAGRTLCSSSLICKPTRSRTKSRYLSAAQLLCIAIAKTA